MPDREDEAGWRRWLPWIALAIIILVVAWLIWLYADWKTPQENGVSQVTGATIAVPDVVGLDADEAEQRLEDAGLVSEEDVSYDQYTEVGAVSSQAPVAGTRVAPGSIVIIGVVSGVGSVSEADVEEPDYQGEAKGMTSRSPKSVAKAAVPDLVGLSESAAVAAVEAKGLVARPIYQPRINQPRRVIEQSPAPGELAPVGSQVHFLIVIAPKY